MKTWALDCSYYQAGHCRSCSEIETSYQAQLNEKKERLIDLLSFLDCPDPLMVFPSKTQGFRNKAKMSVTGSSENPVIGITGKKDLDLGQDLTACLIHHPKLEFVLRNLSHFLRLFRVEPYRIKEKKGELKGLILFYSERSDEMYLRFVLRSKDDLPVFRKLTIELQTEFSFLKCVSANIQPIPHAFLEGDEEIYLTAETTILHWINDFPTRLSPQAFVQTNSEVASQLYRTLSNWMQGASFDPSGTFLELYCGQGAFSFHLSAHFKRGAGIELNPWAVQRAKENAHLLHLDNLEFECASAQDSLKQIQKWGPDLIVVNPPRKGLGESLALIEETLPREFAYSSCNPTTLASDLKKLAPHYRLTKWALFDLFPHTQHFEALVWLTKK